MTALCVGWGYAVTNVMLTYVSSLSHFTGPGFFPAPACQTISVFYVIALVEVAFCVMHICWSLLSFEGYNTRTYWMPIFVYISHILASILTKLLNSELVGSCVIGSVSSVYLLTFLVVGITIFKFHFRKNGMIEYIK